MIQVFNNMQSGKFLPVVPSPATFLCPLSRSLIALCVLALSGGVAHASIAYGSINNFDTVNDTGVQAHGFEIELDDIQSADITYTYDWNHYGTPSIREDTSVPGHTNGNPPQWRPSPMAEDVP